MSLRHRLTALIFAAPLALTSACVPMAVTEGMGKSGPQLSEETLRTITTRLSSDEFEGRGPGTIGETRTVAYLIEQMRAAGLQPGNNGSWTQDVPLVEMTPQNVSPLTFTTPRGTQSLTLGSDFVINSYRIVPETRITNSGSGHRTGTDIR